MMGKSLRHLFASNVTTNVQQIAEFLLSLSLTCTILSEIAPIGANLRVGDYLPTSSLRVGGLFEGGLITGGASSSLCGIEHCC